MDLIKLMTVAMFFGFLASCGGDDDDSKVVCSSELQSDAKGETLRVIPEGFVSDGALNYYFNANGTIDYNGSISYFGSKSALSFFMLTITQNFSGQYIVQPKTLIARTYNEYNGITHQEGSWAFATDHRKNRGKTAVVHIDIPKNFAKAEMSVSENSDGSVRVDDVYLTGKVFGQELRIILVRAGKGYGEDMRYDGPCR